MEKFDYGIVVVGIVGFFFKIKYNFDNIYKKKFGVIIY